MEGRPPSTTKRDTPWALIIFGALAVYALLIVLLNSEEVGINFVFFSTRISMLVLILLCIGLGFAGGLPVHAVVRPQEGQHERLAIQKARETLDSLSDPLGRLEAERQASRASSEPGLAREEVRSAHEHHPARLGSSGQIGCIHTLAEIEPEEVTAFGPAP